MKILINDLMQISGAPSAIKTPALSDIYRESSFEANFDEEQTVNCIGIGYTDATEITISDGVISYILTLETRTESTRKYNNGLYIIPEFTSDYFLISHNGNFIGRVGIGVYRTLGTSPTKEIGFYTTTESRVTLSGQTIPGAGGYCGRRIELDVRYKIDEDVYNDIESAYCNQIMKEYPYFLLLDDEQHKVPPNMLRFYAATDKPLSLLQSSTYKFLYSYKFSFWERF